jgi:hypothetical protein
VAGRYEIRIEHASGEDGFVNVTVHAGNKWIFKPFFNVPTATNSNLKENQKFLCYIDVKIVNYGTSKYYVFNLQETP